MLGCFQQRIRLPTGYMSDAKGNQDTFDDNYL
jgi:hypothetical protein